MNNNYLSIKEWSIDDRPREKLLQKGIQSLSDAELIAIIFGSGSRNESAVDLAKRILAAFNNDLNALARCSVDDFTKFKGIGPAKAINLIAALEIGRRRKNEHVNEDPKITSSNLVYQTMKPYLLDLPHEEFWALFLNRSNRIIEKLKVSQGGISGTVIDVRIILKKALDKLSSGIIVCHNHPSGNTQPSKADIEITEKLKNAGKILDIHLLDHIIFCNAGYYSFADEGLL